MTPSARLDGAARALGATAVVLHDGAEAVLFYGGSLSQWAATPFEVDGVAFNCAEQYMMAKKAAVFRDWASLEAIMASRSPSDQKARGRLARGFDASVWEAVALDVVRTATGAKLCAHPGIRAALLATGDALVVEASPTDTVWGIGLAETDSRALDRRQWRGRNLLGRCIMDVRRLL